MSRGGGMQMLYYFVKSDHSLMLDVVAKFEEA